MRYSFLLCSLVLLGFGCSQPEIQEDPLADIPSFVPEQDAVDIISLLRIGDQTLSSSSTIMVQELQSSEPGWLVLYSARSGRPFLPIVHAPIPVGARKNYEVQMPEDFTANPPRMLFALIHEDTGAPGAFDFPIGDLPRSDANAQSFVVSE